MELINENNNFLMDDEKSLYVADNENGGFYPLFYIILAIILMTILICAYIETLGVINSSTYFFAIIIFCCFSPLIYFANKLRIDRFCTEVILTNKRLIILRTNKITAIPYNEIKRVYKVYTGKGPRSARIVLKNKKTYRIYFLDGDLLKNKLQQIYPKYYDDTSDLTPEAIYGIVFALIMVIILIFYSLFKEQNSVENKSTDFNNSNQALKSKGTIFRQRVEILRFEKKLICEIVDPCEKPYHSAYFSEHPQEVLEACQKSLNRVQGLTPSRIIPKGTSAELESIKTFFIYKMERDKKAAISEIYFQQNKPKGFFIHAGPLVYEGRLCEDYGALERINKQYDLHKVMEHEFVNCNNLATDDLESLLRKYDNL